MHLSLEKLSQYLDNIFSIGFFKQTLEKITIPKFNTNLYEIIKNLLIIYTGIAIFVDNQVAESGKKTFLTPDNNSTYFNVIKKILENLKTNAFISQNVEEYGVSKDTLKNLLYGEGSVGSKTILDKNGNPVKAQNKPQIFEDYQEVPETAYTEIEASALPEYVEDKIVIGIMCSASKPSSGFDKNVFLAFL